MRSRIPEAVLVAGTLLALAAVSIGSGDSWREDGSWLEHGGAERSTALPSDDRSRLLELSPAHSAAVGRLGTCSGVLIDRTWALTAAHCRVAPGDRFCIQPARSDRAVCVPVSRVVVHPAEDLALVALAADATALGIEVEPIRPAVDLGRPDTDRPEPGESIETAGYGLTDSGSAGKRRFAQGKIVEVDAKSLTIQILGGHRPCYGDSGGPVMARTVDGSVRVLGVLSRGSATCSGRDTYSRVDTQREWYQRHRDHDPASAAGLAWFPTVLKRPEP